MRNRSNAVIVATVVAVALGGVWLAMRLQGPAAAQVATSGQFASYTPSRTGDGKPDLNGIWQSLTTANWDLEAHGAGAGAYPHLLGAWGAEPGGQSIVEGGVIPYRPEALASKKANFASRATASVPGDGVEPSLGDPEMKCWMPGVPRIDVHAVSVSDRPDTRDAVLMTHEFNGNARTRPHELAGGNAGRQHILHGMESRGDGRATRSLST